MAVAAKRTWAIAKMERNKWPLLLYTVYLVYCAAIVVWQRFPYALEWNMATSTWLTTRDISINSFISIPLGNGIHNFSLRPLHRLRMHLAAFCSPAPHRIRPHSNLFLFFCLFVACIFAVFCGPFKSCKLWLIALHHVYSIFFSLFCGISSRSTIRRKINLITAKSAEKIGNVEWERVGVCKRVRVRVRSEHVHALHTLQLISFTYLHIYPMSKRASEDG